MNTIDARLLRLTAQANDRPPLAVAPQALTDFAATAAPGATFSYHVGYLAADRADTDIARPITAEQKIVNVLGDIAWALHAAGKVALVQRRVSKYSYVYEMQKLPIPVEVRTHAGCVE
jgi:hypothetical protein